MLFVRENYLRDTLNGYLGYVLAVPSERAGRCESERLVEKFEESERRSGGGEGTEKAGGCM